MHVLSTHVAGFRQHASPKQVLELENSEVSLEREPHNPYDSHAVAVYYKGMKLGYVPRTQARALAGYMDAGGKVRASIDCKHLPDDIALRIEAA